MHDQLVERLNELCRKGNAEIDSKKAEGDRLTAAQDYEGLADLIDSNQATDEAFLRGLENLRPSPPDRDAFARYVRASKRQTGLLDRFTAALRAEDVSAVQTLNESLAASGKQRINAAIDLGADDCGKP